MLIFQLFKTKKMIQELRANPGAFGAGEVRDMLIGLILGPVIVAGIGLILFFILGCTDLFGHAMGFFRVLFWISLFISVAIFMIIRKIILFAMRLTKKTTDKVIHEVAYDVPKKNHDVLG